MLRSLKILVVDDELRFCKSLAQLLRTRDYEVATASCGREALALIGKTVFDLAILDVHLPDMLGTELMGEIKVRDANTSVVVISGEANIDSALAAIRHGAYDYIRKPFEFEELLNTVENALKQKVLRQEKDKINEKLQRSEEKYRYLVQNSPDIIYTLDEDGNFTFLSDALEHLLGFTVPDLIGKHYSTIIWEEDQDKARWFFHERRSKNRSTSGIELRLKATGDEKQKDRDRQYLIVELKSMGIYEQATPISSKRYIGTHGVLRDISARQRLQNQLQNADRMESLGTLAGGIAHDFNNLLMAIKGRSALMSMDLDVSHPFVKHLCAIDECIHSATHLTKQLLGFARGGKYEVKPTNINELIRNSADMFGRTKKEITIETQFHSPNIVVEVDRRQIEQVLLNLYINAWQAMPEGGTLRLKAKDVMLGEKECSPYQIELGRYAHVAITDTGMGMDQRTLQRIFDPFFSTKEKTRGTGLGLASAYGIVKNHGGIINVTSKVDHGTTFNIYLPISQKPIVEALSSKQGIHQGTETILLVDDEEMIIAVGQAMLEQLGYHIIAVQSGREAVETVRRLGQEIDLVILDMIMPHMDGGKTFDCIREIYPEMPVLLSSGYAINGKAEEIMQRGCNGFIQKPFSAAELSQKVRQIFNTLNITNIDVMTETTVGGCC